jgi:hypothetical protein
LILLGIGVTTATRYQRARQELISLITRAVDHDGMHCRPRLDRLVLNNRQAAAVLKMAPAKVSQIPLEELPRRLAKGRGGVKITVVAIVDYLMREAGFGEPETSNAAPMAPARV